VRSHAALLLLLVGCGASVAPGDAGASDACAELVIDAGGEYALDACGAVLVLDGDRVLELWVDAPDALELDGVRAPYFGPSVVGAGEHTLAVDRAATLHVRDHGEPADGARIERSLTWTDAALLDDPSHAGLERLMRTVSDDPGAMLAAWFHRFATTAHSERSGPDQMLASFEAEHGTDPSGWDLDALPFRVTGVHNRIDLADGAHCGELRVSVASIDPLYQPLHLIFLYRQPATSEDLRPDGTAHCASTALRWARLSELDGDPFARAARELLDETLRRDRLLVIESLDFLISPWEWRQWFLEAGALENRPLFQTIDTPRLNAPGPERDAFLAWVSANAAALDARTLLVPDEFRSPSARVNDVVPWIPLDLSGLETSAFPALRQNLEIVGCPACHASDADFVQTRPDRTFSPFYTKELDARAEHLLALTAGAAARPPFGPLQADPVLPP
jgi:hypothetical protein